MVLTSLLLKLGIFLLNRHMQKGNKTEYCGFCYISIIAMVFLIGWNDVNDQVINREQLIGFLVCFNKLEKNYSVVIHSKWKFLYSLGEIVGYLWNLSNASVCWKLNDMWHTQVCMFNSLKYWILWPSGWCFCSFSFRLTCGGNHWVKVNVLSQVCVSLQVLDILRKRDMANRYSMSLDSCKLRALLPTYMFNLLLFYFVTAMISKQLSPKITPSRISTGIKEKIKMYSMNSKLILDLWGSWLTSTDYEPWANAKAWVLWLLLNGLCLWLQPDF